MPRLIDPENWSRRAAFEFFRDFDNPWFNVCVQLDATALVEQCRGASAPSFSLASLYLALRAANDCEPFRYRLGESEVLVHDRIHAGTTHLVDHDRLVFVYFDYAENFRDFSEGAERARREAADRSGGLDPQKDRTDLIHFSSLPWISFTSFSHARNWSTRDSVPKITFGKYHEVGSEIRLPVSVEVHHALMDGYHMGVYLERLQRYLADPRSLADAGG